MKDFLSFLTQIPTPPPFPVVLAFPKKVYPSSFRPLFSVRKVSQKSPTSASISFRVLWRHAILLLIPLMLAYIIFIFCFFCFLYLYLFLFLLFRFTSSFLWSFLSCIILSSWLVSSLSMISFMFLPSRSSMVCSKNLLYLAFI